MRDMMKLALRLMVFALVAAVMLAAVNELTKDQIAANERAKVGGARAEVLGDYDFAEAAFDLSEYTYITNVYVATDAGATVGYVYELTSRGFGGMIDLSLGVRADGTISGLAVANHIETRGLGTEDEAPFLESFVGLKAGAGGEAGAEPAADETDADTSATTGATGTADATAAADATDADTSATTGATGTADATAAADATDADTSATGTAAETAADATDADTSATGTAAETAAADATDADTSATTGATGAADTDAATAATGESELTDTAASDAVASVDGMSGATVSSNAVKNAVAEALSHFRANNLGGGEGVK
ncbi:MAG: hypothetical protein ACOYI5_06780 [Christensenellales bacterium]|jgi:RnfABCDGE-type electron transport complex G subunit